MRSLFELKPYILKYRKLIFIGILFVLISEAFYVIIPILIGRAVDSLKFGITGEKLLWFASLVIGSTLLSGIASFFTRQTIIVASRKIEYDLRNDFYRHVQSLHYLYFRDKKVGDIMAYATNDIPAVRNFLGPGIMYSVETVIEFVVILGIMFSMNLKLTLLTLTPLPLISYLVYKVGKIVHEKYEDIQEHFGTITTVAQENIAGIRVIKSYVREDYEVEKFRKLNFDYMLKNIKLIKVQSLTYPLMILITGISIILVVWYGGYQVIKGAMTLGQITSFLIYLGYLIWPMIAFGWIVNLTQRASASMDRLLEVFKVEPQIKDTNETDFSIKEISGEIKFKNVWFKYPDSESYVLKGINLEIKQGQTVGIVGYTGSGKTTLVNLIPRLFDPDKGEVLIDGINVKKIPLKVLRESIGYVQQEVFLFSDSVKNNITFGVDGVSDEEVFNVAKIAHIYDEVIEFPNGFDTIVGERGITLSGGQRQRVGLARALIKKPKILILDDSLSSVDAYTEEMILKSLKEFRAGRTTIIISHRITAVKDADFIIVLDDGEIVEQGTHDELLELGGIYADLYQKQILEEELERM
ncbi:ATP-binding cassette, subfamily B [Candidatus Kryptonium thompsonii]|uniref:ATP-binding cassette, subfamily B n=3 Tax=Candidatus Kryptonium thompsonii TaxID=1633631 RepID=A0A0N7MQN5_9BACT|nr:ABC transporter ATP-binding protein [Candidatus Kryptonium thompsoni]CUS80202.1 ATP-binding cassette, subfamily B [Candidatus Kryptonium thompsoni]CUS82339.1 ATP-binding cassette, subfamily B [Candidatus Kryptonium thompsoni]CUS84762.1 ATP-binding cassette, subfamily B [Candidatus Kryptonium thompsoni]CUS86734.1 ATP-binding cassette, subfamily B [Candidatus Kryptonium thompsoni]CUS87960.1 ATP-binding cassette, subfamily B [Candidatus Kryptonium thompsoni]